MLKLEQLPPNTTTKVKTKSKVGTKLLVMCKQCGKSFSESHIICPFCGWTFGSAIPMPSDEITLDESDEITLDESMEEITIDSTDKNGQCEYCGTNCCWDDKPCDKKRAELDEWFESDGVNILNAMGNAMEKQGEDFVLPHNREELDKLIDDL